MSVHRPNVHEVRENLAEYLDAAVRGEEVLICRRNQPVARLVAISRPLRKPRPIGRASDAGVALPASFWEPLPAALVEALAGQEPRDGPVVGAARRRAPAAVAKSTRAPSPRRTAK